MLQRGFEVDRYVVEEKLGEGGMAVVYRVRHATLGTRHALKVLSITSRDVRERMIQEGRLQATLNHPNIVAVSDVLDVDGAPGLLMEFVQGPALDHWLFNYTPTIEEAVTIFRGIVAGVGHAHEKGLIHRDLKPANVMLHVNDAGIHPKVTDFGLAKHSREKNLSRTRTGTTMGTPAYMAPEQIRDASTVDRRADTYSLGCILYELICGRPPFNETDIIELFAAVAAGVYPHPRELRPDVPQNVVECIESLVEVNRDFRVADCAAIIDLLDGVDRESITVPVPIDNLNATLPPSRPMPNPGTTTLDPEGPGAALARRFVKRPDTAPPPVDRFHTGSLAPSAPPEDIEPATAALRVGDPVLPPPQANRTSPLMLAALVALCGLVVFSLGVATVSVAGSLWYRTSQGQGPTTKPLPEPPLPGPSPVTDPTVEPKQPDEPESPEPPDQTEPIVPETEPDTPPDVPEPEPVEVDSPEPVEPEIVVEPDPVEVKPAPLPDVVPEDRTTGTFRLSVTGDSPLDVFLRDASANAIYRPGDMIPARAEPYELLVQFPDEVAARGGQPPVFISGGKTTTVKCNSKLQLCR